MFEFVKKWINRKNIIIENLQKENLELNIKIKNLNKLLLDKNIGDFIRRQPTVKLVVSERNLTCFYCKENYKVCGDYHYVEPFCRSCREKIAKGLISQQELERSNKET